MFTSPRSSSSNKRRSKSRPRSTRKALTVPGASSSSTHTSSTARTVASRSSSSTTVASQLFQEADFVVSPRYAKCLARAVRRSLVEPLRLLQKRIVAATTVSSISIPTVHPSQLELGELVGVGGFGLVRRVTKWKVDPPESNDDDNSDDNHDNHDNHHNDIPASWVCKILKPQQQNQDMSSHQQQHQLFVGCHQMEWERHLLPHLHHHPHIVRLHGSSVPFYAAASSSTIQTKQQQKSSPIHRIDDCFLVLEHLPELLTDRLETWRQRRRHRRRMSLGKKSSSDTTSVSSMPRLLDDPVLLREQLETALAVASVLEFLHQPQTQCNDDNNNDHNTTTTTSIILLDLKPANIGFDRHGTLKVFDFGLATVVVDNHDNQDNTDNDNDDLLLHTLPARVGTPRYMAPEVATIVDPERHTARYNAKADVFSFSLVLWQMLTQQKPPLSTGSTTTPATTQPRPPVPPHWPVALRRILERGWSDDMRDRPCMTEYQFVLRDLIRRYCS